MNRLEVKAQLAVSDAGEVTGIAWPFGSADRVGDVIERGAFNNPATLPMLFAHDQAQAVGIWDSIVETQDGLAVKGRLLIEDVARAREVRALVKAGAVTGLSIGFQTHDAKARAKGGRTITALSLHEISIVPVPCHPGAQIGRIKAATDGAAPFTEGSDFMTEQVQTTITTDPALLANVEKALSRIDALETKLNRPAITGNVDQGASNERKAFESFMRRGVERMPIDEAKALTIATDASAGYLAPEAFAAEILKKLVEFSPIRANARVMNIGTGEIKFPRRVTGTTATWTAETADRTESSMVFEQVLLGAHELATFVDVSNALLEDNAYNLESELAADFAESFGKTEGLAFVSGDGTGKPKGILAASGITEVKTGNAATLGTDPAATIIAMFHKLPSAHAQNGVWLMNRNVLGALRTLKDGTGRFIMLDPITEGAPVTLLGRPIVEAVDMPEIGANTFPIVFGDLQGYRIIDRVGLSVLRDPFSVATKGLTRFHARKRVGGDVTNPDRFVKLKVSV